jgi:hypothetical protein
MARSRSSPARGPELAEQAVVAIWLCSSAADGGMTIGGFEFK